MGEAICGRPLPSRVAHHPHPISPCNLLQAASALLRLGHSLRPVMAFPSTSSPACPHRRNRRCPAYDVGVSVTRVSRKGRDACLTEGT